MPPSSPIATPARERLPTSLVAISMVMVASASLYWFFGPARTLHLLAGLFGLTHPRLADGGVDIPPLGAFLRSYAASPITIGLHYVFMPLVLVASIFQFSARLRRSRPRLHRWLGRVFFAALLLGVGGAVHKVVTGDVYGGVLSQVQFGGMAIMTLACATAGGLAAKRRDFAAHERWMWVTYLVLWSSSAMSRLGILLLVPVWWKLGGGRHEDYVVPYNVVVGASWIVPPLIARLGQRPARGAPAASSR